jgi:bla regulator protein BlaR1
VQTLLEVVVSNALVAALLALLAAAVGGLCRRPALTHRLWLLVLLKLVTPPLLPVHLPRLLPVEAASAPAAAEAGGGDVQAPIEPATDEPERGFAEAAAPEAPRTAPAAVPPAADATSWVAYFVPAWLGVALLWLAWNLVYLARFAWCLRQAVPAPPWLQGQAHLLASRLGLRRCPAVYLVPGAVPPMVWGLGPGPRLLFPAGLLDRLDAGQRATLLLHELAHVRRRDHWVRLLELVVVPLYWWHPVVWWARRELHEAEEQCCDAWVVWALEGRGRTYALALLQTLAFCSQLRSPVPAAASGIGQVPHLRRRLTMIMQAKTPRALSGAGVAAVLGLALLLLPLVPVAGQDPDPPAPPPPPGTGAGVGVGVGTGLSEKKLAEIEKKVAERLDQLKKQHTGLSDEQIDEINKSVSKALKEAQVQIRVTQVRATAPKLDALKKALQNVPRVETKTDENGRVRVYVRTVDEEETRATDADVARLEKEVAQKRKELAEAVARLARAKVKAKEAARAQRRKAETGEAGKKPGADRLGNLEQRLDRIMQEVDALRQELRRERQTPPGGLPSRVRPPKPPAPEPPPGQDG